QVVEGLVLGAGGQGGGVVGEFAEAGGTGQGVVAVVGGAQGVGEVGGGRGEGEAAVRGPDGVVECVGLQGAGLLVRGAGVGVEPADRGRGEVAVGAGPRTDRVQGGDGVAGADLAAVDTVVAEVLVGDAAVVVADEAELGDR